MKYYIQKMIFHPLDIFKKKEISLNCKIMIMKKRSIRVLLELLLKKSQFLRIEIISFRKYFNNGNSKHLQSQRVKALLKLMTRYFSIIRNLSISTKTLFTILFIIHIKLIGILIHLIIRNFNNIQEIIKINLHLAIYIIPIQNRYYILQSITISKNNR